MSTLPFLTDAEISVVEISEEVVARIHDLLLSPARTGALLWHLFDISCHSIESTYAVRPLPCGEFTTG